MQFPYLKVAAVSSGYKSGLNVVFGRRLAAISCGFLIESSGRNRYPIVDLAHSAAAFECKVDRERRRYDGLPRRFQRSVGHWGHIQGLYRSHEGAVYRYTCRLYREMYEARPGCVCTRVAATNYTFYYICM